ncbi:cation transporter [Pararhodobacter sp. CCB-MM2]|uniref:cation transporter n=1 Tax=Pararhodobacter sp. CCB-MM2 TaxID=1786003 RepID=UPI00082D3DD2|nr:cation transporter [Pararhodobacter sp. CCB-MM2]
MPHDHDHDFDGASPAYRRALIAVILLNGGLFLVEMTAGALSGSRALQADALDFAADAATYALSLAVIGQPITTRARAAQLKGISLALMGLAVFGFAVWDMLGPEVPRAEVMGAVGFAALAANVASVLILMRWKDGDSNVRSVWLCSRNDAIGNVAVIAAAVAVAWFNSGWPDLIVAVAMAGLFLSSSVQILRKAGEERAHHRGHAH